VDHTESRAEWYELASVIRAGGWSDAILRRFTRLAQPRFKVTTPIFGGPAPEFKGELRLSDLIRCQIEYSDLPQDVTVPDDWVVEVLAVLRRNFEVAFDLETEFHGHGLNSICPIIPDETLGGEPHARSYGLSAWVLYYVRQLQRLIGLDLQSARAEALKWSSPEMVCL